MNRRNLLTGTASSIAMLSVAAADETTWQVAADLPIKTQEIYPAVHQQMLYVAGGIGARLGVPYFTSQSFAYDPTQDLWQDVAKLPEDLHHVGLVSDGVHLFGLGGFNGGYTHIWRMRDAMYRLEEKAWVPHTTIPTPQAEGVVTHHKKRIHVVTGQQPKGQANKARSDHTEANLHWVWDGTIWQNLAPIPTPRNSATGGWIGDNLIVTGGRTAAGNLNTTEVYDALTDKWHTAAPIPLPQAGTASVVHGQSLIVFGGEIFVPEAGVFANVWRYNLVTDKWSALPDLPIPRHGLGAGALTGRAYVIGGATQPGGSGTTNLNEVLDLNQLQ